MGLTGRKVATSKGAHRPANTAAAPSGRNDVRPADRPTDEQQGEGDQDVIVSVWSAAGRSQPSASRCLSSQHSPHPQMPQLPMQQGELFFECTLFLYSVMCLFLLYLNIFKTMWWLPNAHVHTTVKMHLIDPYLLSCIGLMLGRRVTLCFFQRINIIPPEHEEDAPGILRFIQFVLKVPMFVAVFSSFMFSYLRLLQTYPPLSTIGYFCAPFAIYLLQFYGEIFYPSHKLLDVERVRHACTLSPQHIRTEVNILNKDMTYRVKLAFYAGVCTVYLAVCLPLVFVNPFLHVDTWWICEFGTLVFGTSFTLFLVYLFPLQYTDMLHRSSLHLGMWTVYDKSLLSVNTAEARLPASPLLPPAEGSEAVRLQNINEWSENALYRKDALVRYRGQVYQAVGYPQGIAAEPGFVDQQRFYQVSCEPGRLANTLCMMQLFIVLAEFTILLTSHEWQQVLTLALMMFVNYLLLFKLLKDKVIISRIYQTAPQTKVT